MKGGYVDISLWFFHKYSSRPKTVIESSPLSNVQKTTQVDELETRRGGACLMPEADGELAVCMSAKQVGLHLHETTTVAKDHARATLA
mmetsp:Transcript_3375/g.8110  ORF Transcript_3375/g.8110 Transcript_3375/m.8110 type:complete len:88 (+) Transcript_3375:222-485(+)